MNRKHSIIMWKGLIFTMLWMMSLGMYAQTITVKGNVKDDTGLEVIGATIIVEGNAAIGTTTDIEGNYVLNNVPASGNLMFTYVGMKTQKVSVNGRTTINVVMTSDTELLEEVVVVGFGTQKKVNLTGAVSTVDSKVFESRPVASVTQALQGAIPGMNFSYGGNGGGELGNNLNINIRGAGTIGKDSKASPPLVLIDGMEGSIDNLNPQDIESVSVLKDAASSAIYGSRAPFGVILITTKKGKAGQVVVNYNNNIRFTNAINRPETMDSYTFAKYFNRAAINNGEGGSPITMK